MICPKSVVEQEQEPNSLKHNTSTWTTELLSGKNEVGEKDEKNRVSCLT